ncbi:MAG: hypothetical protein ACK4WK_12060, partial [Anaerolineae bacterium]
MCTASTATAAGFRLALGSDVTAACVDVTDTDADFEAVVVESLTGMTNVAVERFVDAATGDVVFRVTFATPASPAAALT